MSVGEYLRGIENFTRVLTSTKQITLDKFHLLRRDSSFVNYEMSTDNIQMSAKIPNFQAELPRNLRASRLYSICWTISGRTCSSWAC